MATNYTWSISFLPLNYVMTWQRNRFTAVALSGWQEKHASRPSTEDNKTEKGRHSRTNQSWLDGNIVAVQERHLHVDEYSQCPAEGNFCNEGGKAIKPQILMDYNHHKGYVDKGDRMANSYSISQHTFKWTKKLFFHLLDVTILSSYILHSSCGGKKISHRDFLYTLVRNMLAQAGPKQRIPRPLGRPPNVESQVARLEVCGRKCWPTRSEMQLSYSMCKAMGVTKFSWSGSVCVWNKHFKDYHTKPQM